ncbi:TonB-dependent siderophore receptor [Neptuniibacter sp. 1_MG-2023]|uniref:TonB-dependent receptor n=1 Tax=Neptuniibacter sp. 1_MG-2023 TaxID=3062662 RepID=UPI0026E3ED2D|nr:TonB-dependent receptor [Neptuniibacter sp. 1_MG-2023]MDO6593015.1 TonB-dependent receptor [Neptuniibacter sp. 1_MG-2023]
MYQANTKKPSSIERNIGKKSAFTPGTLALAISGTLMAGVATAEETISLDKLTVEESVTPDTNPYAVPGSPYLAERLSDPRRTRDLAETPQTITVLTATELADTGRTDLREILDGQPGITVGTGENGNAFGDRYVIRGHEARSDVFVDGMRDPGMTIRESFATEQVEISKGPSSSFAGRGTTGGAVNSATKRASSEYDFTKLSAGIGTDNQHRLSLDTNQVINYDTAIRANILHAEEDVPDRAPADRQRKGAAFSITHQPSDDLEITADYYHFEGNDKPDLGTYLDTSGDGQPVANIPVYLQNEDFLDSEVDTATLRIGYELNPDTRIVNLTRYGTTDNGYVTTGARGTTAYPTLLDATNDTNGYSSATLSTHQGWQEVEYFANQFNLLMDRELGGLNHELVFGLEYTDQQVLNGVYDNTATGASNCFASGRGGPGAAYCLNDASGAEVSDVNSLLQRDISKGDWDSDWNIKTISLSMMDTVDITDKWTVFGGLRYDYYDYKTTANYDPGTGRELTDFINEDGFWNGHVGASYKINPKANVYASFSTATNLNGGESDVGTSCGYGGICAEGANPVLGNPEKTDSWELGTKWRFNDDKLLATAALFRITKSDVMESSDGDSYSTVGTLNTGKNEVEGIELGIAGNLTDKLSVQAGIALMNAKVKESIIEDNVGKTLANFADKSASLHLRYQATQAFAFGGTATYESVRYTGQPDTAANEEMGVPGYTVLDAFASYKVNRDMLLRLNVGNLLDEDYYLAAYRSGAFTYIGDKRNVQLTMEYSF